MIKETIEQLVKLQVLDTRIYAVDELLMKIPSLLQASRDSYEEVEKQKTEAEKEYASLKENLLHEEAQVAQHRELLSNAQKKLTVVLTTHDMNDIEALTDRVILIGKGRILRDGSMSAIKRDFPNLSSTEEVIAALYREHRI